MIPDPTEEIKAIRHRLGADFGFDLARIFADVQRRQRESGRTYLNLPPRKPTRWQRVRPDEQAAPIGGDERS